MGIRELFGTNQKSEVDGIDLDYGDYTIRIARMGGSNKKWTKALSALVKKHSVQIRNDSMPEEQFKKLTLSLFAKHVFITWSGEGLIDEELWGNKEVPQPTEENFVKLMLEYPDQFADIQEQAKSHATFQNQILEDVIKNS